MAQDRSESVEIAVIKNPDPKKCVLEGIETLGGISKYVQNGDVVFIKCNLELPFGFPSNSNFDTVEAVVQSCKIAGAQKIIVGSYPFKRISAKGLSDALGLENFLTSFDTELVFLDLSDKLSQKNTPIEQVREIKRAFYGEIEFQGQKIQFPNAILNANKLISINQVNVEPLFQSTLSLSNLFSILPSKYREIRPEANLEKNKSALEKFKRELAEKIIDIFSIKKPVLNINDLSYVLEGAGPYIYKDSKLKRTDTMVMGADPVAVDIMTLKLMGFDFSKNELISAAIDKKLGESMVDRINVKGIPLEGINLDVKPCVSNLEEINVKNLSLCAGSMCSECYKQTYHLLNLMKTNMSKDLKYLSKLSFVVGENPTEHEPAYGYIIFGDCAIKSTKHVSLRKIIKKTKKKTKYKPNKNILELHGCPPDLLDCVQKIIKFYGKGKVPTLNIFYKAIEPYIIEKDNKNKGGAI